jgi:CRP-like cAMP-binding protein
VEHLLSHILQPLVRQLESVAHLSDEEKEAVLSLPVFVRRMRGDNDIVRDGDRPSQCCIVLEGVLYRYKLLENGKRQIFSFHVAGDIPDLQSLFLTEMDHNLATVVSSMVAFLPHDAVRELNRKHSRIAEIFWRNTLIDAAIFREWIVNVGRRSAYERIAHLFCEVFTKMQAVGLCDGNSCAFPITQTVLGDALGLSTVHVNRSLQKLRAEGLITLAGGILTIDNWERLKEAGGFTPAYLNLRPPSMAAE